jgi:hypothetical protein
MAAGADARATRTRRRVRGGIPIVLVGAGAWGRRVQDQAALGESLASHGYVGGDHALPRPSRREMESEADVPAMAGGAGARSRSGSGRASRREAMAGSDARRAVIG